MLWGKFETRVQTLAKREPYQSLARIAHRLNVPFFSLHEQVIPSYHKILEAVNKIH